MCTKLRACTDHTATRAAHTQTMSTGTADGQLPRPHTHSWDCICKCGCSCFLPSPKFAAEQLTGKWRSLRLLITVQVISHRNIRKLLRLAYSPSCFLFCTIFAADSHTHFPSLTCSQQKFIYLSTSKEGLMLSTLAAARCPGSDLVCPHSFTVHSSGFGSKEHPSFREQRG